MRAHILICAVFLLAACGSTARQSPTVTTSQIDPFALQTSTAAPAGPGYRIGPADLLKLTVFQVKDLSADELRVDNAGNVEVPLIGSVRAAGFSAPELSGEIERRLGDRYLQNADVTVTVTEAASQKITVDGAVTKPGVYEMRGRTTLLQAVAMAEGPVRTAKLNSVAVFRTVNDRRMVAVFDLNAIRGGQAVDPVMEGDDIVIVDSSRLNVVFRDVIAALPAFAAFAYF